jgi:hypothetical protein
MIAFENWEFEQYRLQHSEGKHEGGHLLCISWIGEKMLSINCQKIILNPIGNFNPRKSI